MVLKVHSDASYLSELKARIQVGGNLFLGNYSDASNPNIQNGTLLAVVSILKHVVSSSLEAEVGFFLLT